MNPHADMARERRMMRPAGIAALVGGLAIAGSSLAQQRVLKGNTDAERLTEIHAHSGELILFSVIVSIGFTLFILPLVHLFRADAARSEKVRKGLVGLMYTGPAFVALSILISAIALGHVSNDFIAMKAHAPDAEKLADHLVSSSAPVQVGSGFALAGKLGVSIGVFYSSLWALRVGLLTRFVGTFGMAVGVVFILLSFGVLIWFIVLGMTLLGASRARLPAWDAGVAVPWPTTGEKMAEQMGHDPKDAGDVVQGSGSEVDAEPADSPPPEPRQKRKRRK